MSGIGLALPLPVLSMNFFKSVLKNSNTYSRATDVSTHLQCSSTNRHVGPYQVKARLVVLLNVLNAEQPAAKHQKAEKARVCTGFCRYYRSLT